MHESEQSSVTIAGFEKSHCCMVRTPEAAPLQQLGVTWW